MNKYNWGFDDIEISQCAVCRHKRKNDTCDAFPNQIPASILTNKHDHRHPHEGDNGILFERLEPEDSK